MRLVRPTAIVTAACAFPVHPETTLTSLGPLRLNGGQQREVLNKAPSGGDRFLGFIRRDDGIRRTP
jgi:hypothetical protein